MKKRLDMMLVERALAEKKQKHISWPDRFM